MSTCFDSHLFHLNYFKEFKFKWLQSKFSNATIVVIFKGVVKVILKGNSWSLMVKKNLIKMSLLQQSIWDWIWPINKCQKCQSMCYCVNEKHDNINNRLLVFLNTTPCYIFQNCWWRGESTITSIVHTKLISNQPQLQENMVFITRKIGQKVPQMALVRLDQDATLDKSFWTRPFLTKSFWWSFFINQLHMI
jgi:hypothetical protein